jgi:cupin superfamily acireductone dioxygenase involved in methionine salvage
VVQVAFGAGGHLAVDDLLTAVGRGDIVAIPVLLRRLIRVPDGLAHIVRLPVSAVLKALRLGSSAS